MFTFLFRSVPKQVQREGVMLDIVLRQVKELQQLLRMMAKRNHHPPVHQGNWHALQDQKAQAQILTSRRTQLLLPRLSAGNCDIYLLQRIIKIFPSSFLKMMSRMLLNIIFQRTSRGIGHNKGLSIGATSRIHNIKRKASFGRSSRSWDPT